MSAPRVGWWATRPNLLWRQNLGIALAGSVLVGLFLYSWGPGPAVTSDSWHYLAAARSWVAVGELRGPTGAPYVIWGPLYPILLARLGSSNQAMVQALMWLHGVGLLGSLIGWSWLGRQLLGGEATGKRLFPWVLALNTPWLTTAKFVWSETGFLLLFTAYAVALYSYLNTRQLGWLLVATVAGLLLPLQRTAGLFLLAGIALGMAIAYGRALRPYAFWLTLHLLLSVAGGLVWQVHVWHTGLDLPLVFTNPAVMGIQALSDFSFMLLHWLLPLPIPVGTIPLAYIFAGAAVVVVLVTGAKELGKFGQMLLVASGVYVALHTLSYMLSRGAAGFHDSERYAAVFFGPLMLMLFGALRRVVGGRPRLLRLLVLLWLLYPLVRVLHNAEFLRSRPTPLLTVFPAPSRSQLDWLKVNPKRFCQTNGKLTDTHNA